MHKVSENVYLEVGFDEPIESENLVEFRLLYQGSLPTASRDKTRAPEKQEIRKLFHLQLRHLWWTHPQLRQFAEHTGRIAYAHELDGKGIAGYPDGLLPQDESIGKAFVHIGNNWNRSGYQCVPLVTQELALRCSLDILLLRPGEDKFIFEQGDIDGQVKTLFDALKIPKNLAEAGGTAPGKDETPFFCLLEDDKLISEVRVVSDRLLLLPHEREVKANDAFAVIHVRINHKTPGTFDQWFA